MSRKLDFGNPDNGRRRRLPSFVTVISFSIVAGVIAPAYAIVPVTDASHQIVNVLTQVQTRAQEAAQFAKENTQFAREWQQIQDTYTNIKNIFDLQPMPQNFDMTERPENFGVKERCAGADSGFSLGGVIGRVLPDDKKDIPSQQAQICASIVVMENRKNNELVKMYKTAEQRAREAKTVAKNAKASKTVGDQQGNVQQAQYIANMTETDITTSKSQLEYYDATIASLKNDQTVLARRALKGSSSPIGTIIKTGALAGALKVNKSN